ncbi:hypothetical protein ACIZ62_08420 [Acetobacterium carbinolicum]|jgi:hypothetical protein
MSKQIMEIGKRRGTIFSGEVSSGTIVTSVETSIGFTPSCRVEVELNGVN